ncbi:hypothetical protein [Cryobacterium sp. Hz9]|uniref:hypothetical protein n=1 Tax=Cryobacterium sp. Hz9 TaxID=1259167 RepID=UPI001069B387|nr:hypothetical protein [Cryobacterium sp. Hz9]TFB67991.1 hypothetical protein E3N85_06345 [Cryobacterium sp. Hz9]
MVDMSHNPAGDGPAAGPDYLWGIEGGCWLITTEDSIYRIDLDAMTIDRFRFRFPDPLITSRENGPRRPLKELVQCRVGKNGYWLLEAEGADRESIEHFWQRSSRVISIQPVPANHTESPDR